MTESISLSPLERSRLAQEAIELALSSPALFRRWVRLGEGEFLADQIQPWQAADFAALDSGWAQLAGRTLSERDSSRPIIRAYIERPRGHSKTSDMAIQIAWILLAARRVVRGVAAAADREQAGLLLAAVQRLAAANPEICGTLIFTDGAIRNPTTGSRIDLISSDVASSYGILPDFVICDELSHWNSPELWYSLLSSAAKRPECVLAVLTNAGVGRGWQWEVRENASRSTHWHFSSLDGPHAPWITERSLEEQRVMLPPPVYERLWLNRWQHSDGEFVSLAEAECCVDPLLFPQLCGRAEHQYFAGIDYAEKHDYTVGTIVHREGERIIVDRMDVVRPSANQPIPIEWVNNWIERAAAEFPNLWIVLDDYQLVGTCQKYEQRFNLKRFRFLSGQGNHELAVHLRHLILQRRIAWYPGCGAFTEQPAVLWQETPVSTLTSMDDLTSELASLLLRQSISGRVRIDHRSDLHDDRAFALGMACLELAKMPAVEPAFLEITDWM